MEHNRKKKYGRLKKKWFVTVAVLVVVLVVTVTVGIVHNQNVQRQIAAEEQTAMEQAEKEAAKKAKEKAEQEAAEKMKKEVEKNAQEEAETKTSEEQSIKEDDEAKAVEGKSSGIVVCIDAGHQGKGDSSTEPVGPGSSTMKAKVAGGTRGTTTGVYERDLTLDIALQLRTELQNRGYTVVMTRETNNINISNKERAEVANKAGADVSIRLHADGSNSSGISGASCLTPTSKNPYISNLASSSSSLASDILTSYCEATGMKNRGVVGRDDLTGTNWSQVPCALLEMGFMTNPSDDTKMEDPDFQSKMVQGIANGIDAYFGK